MERSGDSLLYVRYRCDPERGVRLKTVEIVVDEKPWRPRARFSEEEIVMMVAYSEQDLRTKLKAAGGKWDPEDRLWQVSYGAIRGTELERRILNKMLISHIRCRHPI